MTITTKDTLLRGHPLDPLTEEEVNQTTHILASSGRITSKTRVMAYSLQELPKDVVLAYQPGQAFNRDINVVMRDHEHRLTIEAVVSLTEEKVVSWRERSDVQPALTYPEVFTAMEVAKKDSRLQEALAKRGITELESVVLFPWTAGNRTPGDDAARGRLIRMQATVSTGPEDNYYARPVEGLIVTVELDSEQVVQIEDHGVIPVPKHPGNYTAAGITDPENIPSFPQGTRTDLKTISITQPDGVSFAVEGHQVTWQKWRLRVGFTPREGLVLHLVEYFDQERWRPVLYRAALSEMYVPYGDASPTHNFKNVFDAGEVGIGVLANSLELGCDCLGEIHYFDAVVNDAEGQAATLKNAMCMHEEDYSLLWKHLEYNEDGSSRAEVRRSRRLVISSISTVGNYEYGFYWYLYQDGTIQYEIKLTGIIAPAAIMPGEKPVSGTLVAPGLYGPNHQHYFNVRLDMMVDGVQNSAVEVNCEPLPLGPENPWGNAWVARETPLASEAEAQRTIETRTARYWKIVNSERPNALGQPTGYKLVPGANTFPFAHEGSYQWNRGGFIRNHFWVTAYDPKERYAAGDYPNQQQGGDGLPLYVQQNRPLANSDLVVWYTFGSNHVVRPEDWPVMPVDMLGFMLKPAGFFVGNPGLDVAASDHCDHPME